MRSTVMVSAMWMLSAALGWSQGSLLPWTVCASRGTAGAQSNGESVECVLSADGRYVAFNSAASNLVAGDTNGEYDIFVFDRISGETERVSVGALGAQANGASSTPSISADGRYVAFASEATNLVAGDTNGFADVFVHDREDNTTVRVNTSTLGSQSNGTALWPSLDSTGLLVAFYSEASDLIEGDTNGVADVFVKDILTGEPTRVSLGPEGAQSDGDSYRPYISADGNRVAFDSGASNLVENDTNVASDVFVFDRNAGTTVRASVSTNGDESYSNPPTLGGISETGRYVVFTCSSPFVLEDDSTGTDVYLRDLQLETTELVSQSIDGTTGPGYSIACGISADARFVLYASIDTDQTQSQIPGGILQLYVRDRDQGENFLVSRTIACSGLSSAVLSYAISADGQSVAFATASNVVVDPDTNQVSDVFVSGMSPVGWFDCVGATLRFTPRLGVFRDRAEVGKDQMSLSGSYSVSTLADGFDPLTDSSRIHFGRHDALYEFDVDPGNNGWKVLPNGKLRFTSPKGVLPKISLLLDPVKGKFTFTANKLDYPEGSESNVIDLLVTLGKDHGRKPKQWTETSTAGLLKYKLQ